MACYECAPEYLPCIGDNVYLDSNCKINPIIAGTNKIRLGIIIGTFRNLEDTIYYGEIE